MFNYDINVIDSLCLMFIPVINTVLSIDAIGKKLDGVGKTASMTVQESSPPKLFSQESR